MEPCFLDHDLSSDETISGERKKEKKRKLGTIRDGECARIINKYIKQCLTHRIIVPGIGLRLLAVTTTRSVCMYGLRKIFPGTIALLGIAYTACRAVTTWPSK